MKNKNIKGVRLIVTAMVLFFIIFVIIRIYFEESKNFSPQFLKSNTLIFGLWIIIILFVNLVGAIVFLVAGRKPAAAVDPLAQGAVAAQAPPAADRAARAADVLYGSPGDDQQ